MSSSNPRTTKDRIIKLRASTFPSSAGSIIGSSPPPPLPHSYTLYLLHSSFSPHYLTHPINRTRNRNRNCNRDRDGLLRPYLITNHPIFLLL
ncbi:hypothetical protein L1887_25979 [Cichorium endivia]|nr:hypothetical protein L1887_25979 [Cichorium endivia]